MQKNNMQSTENKTEDCSETSENVLMNIKYISKLEMQRSILNKLVDINLNQSSYDKDLDQGKSETNELLTNK